MITTDQANNFVLKWIHSWNSHHLELIMEHYDSEVEFHSPFILLLKFNDKGTITSKDDLKRYFKIGLDTHPDLTFKLHNVFTGINTVTIYYTSVNNRMAAEVFHLNKNGKAIHVFCNYSNTPSLY